MLKCKVEVGFMLATLETIEILSVSESVAKMVLQSEVADRYRYYYDKLRSDPETVKKIQAFVKKKEQYEEVQRFGRFHPDYRTVMKETRELKREMDLDENVANFRRAENELQEILDEISMLIGQAVSPHIKVVTGNPFFNTSSSCGCGSNGSCGCSA